MRSRILSMTFVFAAFLLLSRPVAAAHFCIETPFRLGVANAELIFSGRITKVESVETLPGDVFSVKQLNSRQAEGAEFTVVNMNSTPKRTQPAMGLPPTVRLVDRAPLALPPQSTIRMAQYSREELRKISVEV